MSDFSPELNLALAVDDDDTADYLDGPTNSLRTSLLILDGLFNAATGHAHNGSHQGGALQFLDLTVGQNLTVNGATDLKGAVHARQTLLVDGATTLAGLTSGATTHSSLTVTGTTRLQGAVTVDVSASIPTLNAGTVVATGNIQGRDLIANDGTEGIVRSGVGNLYLRPALPSGQVIIDQNTTVQMGQDCVIGRDLTVNRNASVSGQLSANAVLSGGSPVWTNANAPVSVPATASTIVQRDASGNIVDPKISGQVDTGSGVYTFPDVAANVGRWRFVKAWGASRVMNLTNGTLILWTVQYTSGQYTLAAGDSLSCYCDGTAWWVL